MGNPADATTQVHRRREAADGVEIRAGRRRVVITSAQIAAAALAGLGSAWGFARSELSDLHAADASNAAAIVETKKTGDAALSAVEKSLSAAIAAAKADAEERSHRQEIVLAQINTSLAALRDGQAQTVTRVAEIQTILMRAAAELRANAR